MIKSDATVEFRYDHNGLRTQKMYEHNGYFEATNYTYHGKLLIHMNVCDDILHFFYDNEHNPSYTIFKGEFYRYIHNLHGDIVGILDNSGALVVEYKYDAWGKLLSTTGTLAETLGSATRSAIAGMSTMKRLNCIIFALGTIIQRLADSTKRIPLPV